MKINIKKLLADLVALGIVIPTEAEAKAETVLGTHIPDGELFTQEELDAAAHEIKEKDKNIRELNDRMIERVTGMKREQFAEQDRFKLMEESFSTKLSEIEKAKEESESKLAAYQEKEKTAVADAFAKNKTLVDEVLADEANAVLKTEFPTLSEEPTFDEMTAFNGTVSKLQKLKVPQFADVKTPAEPNDTSPAPEKVIDYTNMTESDRRAVMGGRQ